ncbi:hypothetical protein [Neobacillus massiliamazoniensis]|uniref:hypothetical protein n=1 Tax=Neobacillus massiliamazoniensis TaxID=1499688 RepID=UPI00159EC206|nr:hypothetical protein [Neobacillus massiliamazoniensis]
MVIEYVCTNEECGHTFLDVVVITFCKCPICNAETEPIDWNGLEDDITHQRKDKHETIN